MIYYLRYRPTYAVLSVFARSMGWCNVRFRMILNGRADKPPFFFNDVMLSSGMHREEIDNKREKCTTFFACRSAQRMRSTTSPPVQGKSQSTTVLLDPSAAYYFDFAEKSNKQLEQQKKGQRQITGWPQKGKKMKWWQCKSKRLIVLQIFKNASFGFSENVRRLKNCSRRDFRHIRLRDGLYPRREGSFRVLEQRDTCLCKEGERTKRKENAKRRDGWHVFLQHLLFSVGAAPPRSRSRPDIFFYRFQSVEEDTSL